MAASGQSPSSPAVAQSASTSLNDALLAKATALYDSTAKSGLKSFDCQVHPDWKQIMLSSRHGAAVAENDPRLALVNPVKITLHARMGAAATGSAFTLDWQPLAQPASKADADLLDRAHHGIENTLTGVLKLWSPLVDGSVAESLGDEDATITTTGAGYTLRSKDKSLTEEFDRNLLLSRSVSVDGGATVDIAPSYEPGASEAGAHGLLPQSFVARISSAGAMANTQQMQVGIAYQAVSGVQIPASVNVEVTGVVTMNFKLDGCVVNAPQ